MDNKPVEIEIVVGGAGDVTVDVHGAQGPSCKELTKGYTDLLSSVTIKLKEEYARSETTQRLRGLA